MNLWDKALRSAPECSSKRPRGAPQPQATAEHLVLTLAMCILQQSHCFFSSVAINRLNPQMPWPYLEWNILSALLVDLLSIRHPAAQSSDRAESVTDESLPLYYLFLV